MVHWFRLRIVLVPALIVAWTIVCLGFHSSTMAQEFRINSEIYTENSNMSVAQNVTLFSNGLVYDFQLSNEANPSPMEIVVFNSQTRTLILLDTQRKMRMELQDLRLLKILDQMRTETQKDPRSKFLVEDTFSEDTDWSNGWVTLESPTITYRYKGEQPKDITNMPLYFEFLDQFTQLIASDPQKIPPFARIELNKSIKRKGWFPTEVQISVRKNRLFRKSFTAKSKHVMVNELSSKDREWIADAKRYWQTYEQVDLAMYRRLNKPMSAKKASIASATKAISSSTKR